PETAILSPVNDGIVSALNKPIRIQGAANDPEGPGVVQVCVKTAPPCSTADWKNAAVGSLYAAGWHYDWAPPADGTYNVFARAWDVYGVAGTITGPVIVNVDSTPPSGATFDLGPMAYFSTTFSPETLAAFTITGRITDTPGAAYVSGAGNAEVLARLFSASGEDHYLRGESVLASPGAASSAFSTRFSLPSIPFNGDASPYAQGIYLMQLSARDRAGNALVNGDALMVIVDDTPPFVYVRVPQVISTTGFELGGRADDTVLDLRRTQSGQQPYPISQTLTMRDTQFIVDNPPDRRGRGYVVGDLNGDTIDDVVGVTWDPGKPLQAGIFFGKVTGFASTLNLQQADVQIIGELDFTGPYTYGPSVAINAPGLFDVNGDGIGDLLLGDPNVNSARGRAYVLLGRRVWPMTINLSNADWRLSVGSATFFGGSVASAGDVDGDGLSDVLVGAATEGAGYEMASLYLGQERGVPAHQSRLYACGGSCPSPRMPNLAGLGDINGDGLSDFLLASSQGVWLIPGRSKQEWPNSDAAQLVSIGLLVGNGRQQTVAPAGDVNGDGLRDMLIGDPLATTSRVFVVFGRRPENPFPTPPLPFTLTTSADISFKETTGSDRLPVGASLTPMGDLDRDGKDDYAFGHAGLFGGAAIAVSSQTPRLRDMSPLSATNFIYGTQLSQLAGAYLSSGDINGDAIRDVMVGAPGMSAAYLFRGDPPSLIPSDVRRVEIGVAGPIVAPDLPYTATLPATWSGARLGISSNGIRPFSFTLSFREDGDYRIYARAIDYAGNRLSEEAWYVGNVWVNTDANPIPTLASALDMWSLYRQGYLHVKMSGMVTSTEPIQHLRIFDGEQWTRMPLSTSALGDWVNESDIERSDQRQITFRAVARDAFGNSTHAFRRVTTDTLVARPVLNANLPANDWLTNITPTLVVTWHPVVDAGGPVTVYATIDTVTKTVPTTLVTTNQVTRTLDTPGAW
ncbi:MAG: FG-GAP-like repeat-containing protein, partial [Burkholderiaceae bacterium]|nr:FG-GAP-like repeat-containing protein [Burkholderiaceae bacterium]